MLQAVKFSPFRNLKYCYQNSKFLGPRLNDILEQVSDTDWDKSVHIS
jgi:hypothetical protein